MTKYVLLFLVLVPMLGCEAKEMTGGTIQFPSIMSVPSQKWNQLAQKKIFFGHQSVGFNIIDGIKDILSENSQITLNIVQTRSGADFSGPIFAHAPVGRNVEPVSKLDDFIRVLEDGVGGKADIVFLKLCFVDVSRDTDVASLWDEYKKKVSHIQTMYPYLALIHTTVPLFSRSEGFLPIAKSWLKKILGKPDFWGGANGRRTKFNELVRREYSGKMPVFDIAEIESTFPDGRRFEYSEGGKTVNALVPLYTDDGGHLNNLGRKKVAEQLLILLASLQK